MKRSMKWMVVLPLLIASYAAAQATQPARARGGGGRGGVAGATPAQTAAIASMTDVLGPAMQAENAAQAQLTVASLLWPRDDAAIKAKLDALMDAERALAKLRADGVEKLQSSPDKLTSDQLATLATTPRGRGPVGTSAIPGMTSLQSDGLTQLTGSVQPLTQAVNDARQALARAAYANPRDDAAIEQKLGALRVAELSLQNQRASSLAKIQATSHPLAQNQLAALAAGGGVLVSGNFSEPQPIDFNDHTGYVALFDGKTLNGWDGNPKFWRVEDGAIIGESTPQNPSGNTYLVYRDMTAKDFTLKFEIKVEGTGGSGFQYRSKSGIPWLTAVAPNVIANAGPTNLAWMLTGPQADFWPSRIYSGQFYSENTPMRIEAFRGQVVEGAGLGTRRLMGNIGDRTELGKLVKANDWNQYTVIARGGTFIHIVNGQLMAVMIDDDPDSSNNQPGLFGIEIEATTKVSVRNVWVKQVGR